MTRRRTRSIDLAPNSMAGRGHHYAALFAARTMQGLDRRSNTAGQIWSWAVENAQQLALPAMSDNEEDAEEFFSPRRRGSRSAPPAEKWSDLRRHLEGMAVEIAEFRQHSRVFEVAKEFGLDTIETDVLDLLVAYNTMAPVEELLDRVTGDHRSALADYRRVATVLGYPPEQVAARLQRNGPLRSSGLVEIWRDGVLRVLTRFLRIAIEPAAPSTPARELLLGKPQEAPLAIEEFAHLGPQLQHLKAVLAGGLAQGEHGMGFLLWGAPGTGKTELSKTLANHIGVPIYAIGETDEDGGEPNRSERLGELRMALRLLAGGPPAVLLLDEAEDVLATEDGAFGWSDDADDDIFAPRRADHSRAYIHRLLETASVPIIFTANSLRRFNPATLRRMACCVEMQIPPVQVRARLWREAAAAEGVAVPDADLRDMAHMFPAAPAIARSAMRTARLAGGDAEMVRMTVAGVMKAMNRGRVAPTETATDIDVELVQADVDLAGLADRVAGPEAPRDISLLLSGPPGSGKSAFVRHLAERMGLPVLQKRSSDLLNMYVGGTEQRIAAAFEEARRTEAFLIFDEADSLLAPRESAHRSWEVSQVNEMLTQMERHPLPFAATTNLLDRVDSAAMRRFLVKARFDYLSPAQVRIAFSRFFGLELPRTCTDLDRLTPADFALVKRGAALRGDLGSAEAMVQALRAEQAAKPGQTRSVGFMR